MPHGQAEMAKSPADYSPRIGLEFAWHRSSTTSESQRMLSRLLRVHESYVILSGDGRHVDRFRAIRGY